MADSDRVARAYAAIAAADRPEVFIHLRPQADVAAEHAAALAAGFSLAGMLLAVKDNVDVAGLPTTAACPGFTYVPQHDAPTVAALRAAGAVVIGKTNLDQFATGLVGTRSPHGAVRDSRRPDHISGGSSSGSAVAVALGFADIAIGTDTAGSGRIPAGLQGIVGVKPTVGAISTAGVVPACASYDCVSIFAADIDTADLAMTVMSGAFHPEAVGRRPFPSDTVLAAPQAPRVAVPATLTAMSSAWVAAFDAVVTQADSMGWDIVRIDMTDFLAAARLLYEGALVAERYDAVGGFLATAGPDAGVDPTVAGIIGAADRFTATDLLADRRRVAECRASAMAALDGADALLVPTAPMHPTLAQVAADPVGVNATLGTYTNFANLFDLCAVAVPAGEVDEGDAGTAQFGITLLAPAHHDAVVMDLARRFTISAPAPAWPEAVAEVVELAVFGAHLKGQPLQWQLTERGARWAGEIVTAPRYRLLALDTTPPKPGLVEDISVGRSIRGEKWVVSAAALGSFLAALPEPMMLGAITLSDGSSIIGFGCSQQAAADGNPLDVDHWLAR
ncbi:allophanate hydrolase [Williamsia sp. CHRR-6]|nr:allophanate hydrolase [Williamsia sp. CHRR-6]